MILLSATLALVRWDQSSDSWAQASVWSQRQSLRARIAKPRKRRQRLKTMCLQHPKHIRLILQRPDRENRLRTLLPTLPSILPPTITAYSRQPMKNMPYNHSGKVMPSLGTNRTKLNVAMWKRLTMKPIGNWTRKPLLSKTL